MVGKGGDGAAATLGIKNGMKNRSVADAPQQYTRTAQLIRSDYVFRKLGRCLKFNMRSL